MFNKAYSSKEAISIICKAAKEYDSLLNNHDFMIVYYYNESLQYKLISFQASNFKHLTGAVSILSPIEFYKHCQDDKLAPKHIKQPNDVMNLKLSVLPFLSKVLYSGCMIGDFLKSGIVLESDYFVGKTKVVSVGFVSNKHYDSPRTLLCRDIREITSPTLKVEAIFRKNKREQYFSEYTYCHKDFDINKVKPTEFTYLIQNPHYYKGSPDTAEPLNTNPSSDLLKRSNLSEEQIIALSSTQIKFTAQKTGEDTYCIVFQKSDLENINSVLSSLSTKNKTEPPKSKR